MRAANGIYIPHGQPVRYYMGRYWWPIIYVHRGRTKREIISIRWLNNKSEFARYSR